LELQNIKKKWLLALLFLYSIFFIAYFLNNDYKKCIAYFNTMSFLISIVFMLINLISENQTPAKKVAYSLAAIGNKFLLSIIAIIGYFMFLYQKNKMEILIALSIYAIYFILSYYFLFQLTKIKQPQN
jgi:peptidoglycan/LPS O-acetylase OafA/YrhL